MEASKAASSHPLLSPTPKLENLEESHLFDCGVREDFVLMSPILKMVSPPSLRIIISNTSGVFGS
jgi:hypothetical protein